MTFLFYFQPFLLDGYFITQNERTGESHVVVTDDNGQFSTSAEWASHKHNTNAGKNSEDGVWFGTSEPDDSKGALPYDTYIIEEMRCESNKGFELVCPQPARTRIVKGAKHTFYPLLQLHNHTDSDWCLCIGRFSVLPLLLRQFQEATAPSKAGKNGTGK